MSETSKHDSIEEFISVIQRGKEIGLVMAKDDTELSDAVKAMEEHDFKRLPSPLEYKNNEYGWYLIINDGTNYKEVYDFVCQYPLSIVSLFDSVNSQTVTFKPDYKNSIILVMKDDILKDLQKANLDLLGRVGPAYRME